MFIDRLLTLRWFALAFPCCGSGGERSLSWGAGASPATAHRAAAGPALTRDASSLKRLAYIARRVRFIQELEARRVISIQNIEGIKNPADVLTKYLGKPDYIRYTSRLYNGAVDPESHTCNAASAQRRKGGV